MATTLKLRRGTTAQHSTFTGTEGEVTVDTDKDTVVVHDGTTAGGFPLVGEKGNQTITGIKTFDNGLKTDTISEETSAAGVTVDGVVLKDNGASLGGNLTFTGTGNRITGDFSNATVANRVTFQTSTANASTVVAAMPNGTGTASAFRAYSNSTPDNTSIAGLTVVDTLDARFASDRTGTGSYLPMTFYTGGSERVRIDTSGNVGIGTSSPSYKLQVSASDGIISVINGTTKGVRFTTDSNGSAVEGVDNTGAASYQPLTVGGSQLQFTTSGTERMRIDSSGNVLVGTTSFPGGSTSRFLSQAPASSIAIHAFSGASSDEGQEAIRVSKTSATTTTSQVFVRFTTGANTTAMGQINANGINAAAFGSWSDIRLKENIEDLPLQLDNICALRPVEFDYKTGGHQIGFIAQEMQEIYPDVVGEDSDGMLTVTGWSKTEARLVKAIQELKAELDTVKAEIATLKGN